MWLAPSIGCDSTTGAQVPGGGASTLGGIASRSIEPPRPAQAPPSLAPEPPAPPAPAAPFGSDELQPSATLAEATKLIATTVRLKIDMRAIYRAKPRNANLPYDVQLIGL